jgi:predicted nuclease of predicted toxin-antitoxin system
MKFATDADFDNDILRGLLRRNPTLDNVRVQDVGLRTADDPTILEWAASEGRILLTHDVNTMTDHAYLRLEQGLSMPGIFVVPQELAIHQAIEDLLLMAAYSFEGEYEEQVRYLPLP